jgi:integrase
MQEIRRYKPSTVSRRFSVTAGFYRTCVLDGILEHSPAEHVRRPAVPAESPTLGFTHLQFEALLTTARESPNPCDFALVAMLGLLGLRIFEATAADIADLGEEHGHRVLRVCGKATKIVLVPRRLHGLRNLSLRLPRRAPPRDALHCVLESVACPYTCARACMSLMAMIVNSTLSFVPAARSP